MSTTCVYRYGLLPPTLGAETVDEQMRLSHFYRNALTEIERNRRFAFRWLRYEHPILQESEDACELAFAELKDARADLKAARSFSRSRSDTKEERDQVRILKERADEAKKVRDNNRKKYGDDLAWGSVTFRALAFEKQHEACEEFRNRGLHWGTYLVIDQAADQARKSRFDPKFKRWDGSSVVGVQIQQANQPLSIDQLFACTDTRLQLDLTPLPIPGRIKSVHGKEGKPRPRVRLRVGSDKRKPIWAEWPVILHRELPKNARIVWAKVIRKRVEVHWEWSLHLTVHVPDPEKPKARAPIGSVAVDLGWRLRDDILRVGYFRGSDGKSGEIVAGAEFLRGMKKVSDLQSIRDKMLDEMTAWLLPWLRSRVDTLPDWLRAEFRHMYAWKSKSRFGRLVLDWSKNRWSGDEEAFERMKEWRVQDKHLWTWEDNLREQALRHRKEGYRVLAAELARSYRTLVLEDFDLRVFQRRQKAESERVDSDAAHSQQKLASPHELRLSLINAFSMRGGDVEKYHPAYTTRRCHVCGSKNRWENPSEITHTCDECGSTWDRDDNACRNLLRTYSEQKGDDENTGVARIKKNGIVQEPKQSKWGRRGRHKKSVESVSPAPF